MPETRFLPYPPLSSIPQLSVRPSIPRTSLMPITPPAVEPGIFEYLREMAGRIGGPRYTPTGESLVDVPQPQPNPNPIPTPTIPTIPQSPTSPPLPSTDEPPSPLRPSVHPSAVETPQFSFVSPLDFGTTKTEGAGAWKGVPYPSPGTPAPTPAPPSAPTPPPISFAWGGGTPQEYRPGETSIADFAGAPTRDSFMGRATTPGRGTLSVMNPPAYQDTESLYNDLERQRIQEGLDLSRRAQQDPFWQEREQANIWKQSEVGAQSEIAAAADKRIAETFAKARERLKTNPSYLNPQNPDGSPVRDPEAVRRDMEAAIDAQEDAARIAVLGGSRGGGRSPSMPGTIFR